MTPIRSFILAVFFGLALTCVIGETGARWPSPGPTSLTHAPDAYHGPKALGPFRLEDQGGTPLKAILNRIGPPAQTTGDYLCYEDSTASAFLWIERASDDGTESRGICLSRIRNCLDPFRAASNFAAWKTERNVGLGSSESKVLTAYGQPTTKILARDGRRALYDLFGGRVPGQTISGHDSQVTVLEYKPPNAQDDLRESDFGIEAGKVIWIRIYNDD